MPVIHVWYIVEQGAHGLKQNAPLFQGVKDANALVRGTWGAAPADGLEPQDGDHVVEKMRMNGFYDTRLDILLRGLGVETLIITGAWTNMSIEHTARHAADAAEEIMSAELRHLYLGHLSRECNRPALAHRVMNERLQKIGAHHVRLELASQDVPCPTLQL